MTTRTSTSASTSASTPAPTPATLESLLSTHYDPHTAEYRKNLTLAASLAAQTSSSKKAGRSPSSSFSPADRAMFDTSVDLKLPRASGTKSRADGDGPSAFTRPKYADAHAERRLMTNDVRSREAALVSLERRILSARDDDEALDLYRTQFLGAAEELRVALARLSNLAAFDVVVNRALPQEAHAAARSEIAASLTERARLLRYARGRPAADAGDLFARADEALERAHGVSRSSLSGSWPRMYPRIAVQAARAR